MLDARTEADLGQTALQRHLAAFETGLDLALAAAGERTLVATASGLAEAGADTAANAGAFAAGAICWLECIKTHGADSLDYCSTRTR